MRVKKGPASVMSCPNLSANINDIELVAVSRKGRGDKTQNKASTRLPTPKVSPRAK
jgi:hypothetical protein